MDDMWFKIGSVILLGGMAIYLWPRVKYWSKNSPKGSSKEWLSFVLILLGVVIFVLFLVSIVKN